MEHSRRRKAQRVERCVGKTIFPDAPRRRRQEYVGKRGFSRRRE
uniref:Uncharacterized protein n=1 Tax=Cucumis melo TaxID=3656 RepID=A0A9I9E346_CUCME